jgi:hypothetical protein
MKNLKVSVSFDKKTIYLYDALMKKVEDEDISISKFMRKLLQERYELEHGFK